MKVQSAPNSVCEREYTVPSGGLVPSSKLMWRSYLQCEASVVALALLKMSAKSWYFWGTPERLGVSTGGEADAVQSFASSVQIYSVKFIAPGSLQAHANAAVPISKIVMTVPNLFLGLVNTPILVQPLPSS